MSEPLPVTAPAPLRDARYAEVHAVIGELLADEDDWIAAMASVASELHSAFAYFDWMGFYRLVQPGLLVIGPYQGTHGCLRIEVPRGVCGAAVVKRATQLVPDVARFPGHIACSTSTRSEIVVPVIAPSNRVLGVLDADSNTLDAFGAVDQRWLERIATELGEKYAQTPRL